jgi:hypothetical protein
MYVVLLKNTTQMAKPHLARLKPYGKLGVKETMTTVYMYESPRIQKNII